jgi:hypothetical protein
MAKLMFFRLPLISDPLLIFAFDRPSTKSFLDQLSMTFVRFGTAAVLGAPSAAVQLDSKARATRIRAEISPRRAIASAV